MTIARPRPIRTISGSIHEFVVITRTTKTNKTVEIEILLISKTVSVVEIAVETALPVIALSSPMSSRILDTASIRRSSSMVTVNNALLSL